MSANITLPIPALKAMVKLAPKLDGVHHSYITCGIRIEADARSTTLVVTNGHYLLCHRHELHQDDPDQDCTAFTMPRDMAETIGRKTSKSLIALPAAFDPDTSAITVTCSDTIINQKALEGQYPSAYPYPDWQRVVRRAVTPNGKTAQFDPEYVLLLMRALVAIAGGKAPMLQHNGESPAVLVATKNTFALLMPWRCCNAHPVPDWALGTIAKAA